MQGVLADTSGEPVDALTDITVTLYDDAAGTTTLWTDTFVDVDVVDGFFSLYLGSNVTLDFASLLSNAEIWVGIAVETDPEMDRFQLAAVPFAIEAQVCNQVGSLTESDINSNFMSSSSDAAGITATQITNWDEAYGWGDHSAEGYLTSYTETDPVFLTSTAYGIDSTDVTNWDAAYGWGDHSGLYSPLGHNHDSDYAPLTHTHSWNDIVSDMPAGFADGIDNDSGGDITGVTAGWGLTGGGTTGAVTVTLAQTMTSCPSGYYFAGTNLCRSSWRSSATWGDAQADCFDEGAHVCTYAEFHYRWVTLGSDPFFLTGDWIGDIVGDDTVLCVNNNTNSANFEGQCAKTETHQYQCCMGFGR